MGFKSYVIDRVGQVKILCLLTRWVGGSKKGPKYAYVIYEWSLKVYAYCQKSTIIRCICAKTCFIIALALDNEVATLGS